MPRYIDADALKAKYEQMLPEIGDGYHKETLQWERVETEFGLRCSKCGKLLDDYVNGGEWVDLVEIPNYCPNCGAKMEVSEDA